MHAERTAELAETRLVDPEAITRAADRRRRAESPVGESGKCFIIAADHPARGALGTGGNPMAMADRGDLLDRLCTALANPGCNGVLATADILEDLLLLGALEGKAVFGSMNRTGLAGAAWEIDDRFAGMNAAGIERRRFDGGKTLTRIDYRDPATPSVLENTAKAVDDLAARGLIAMVEPFISRREGGKVVNDLSTEAVVKSVAIASGLGGTSAYTWLKLPTAPDMERVAAASTLPMVLLGGEVADLGAQRESWAKSLALPGVVGLTVGRSLLYPDDGDVAGAIEAVVSLL
ncbi:Cgl0159 family (beta/alpha)8-fold protein [Glycomyces salinus]|uniref:Cgl0159 family (beta/alpha)8-fold protein n=1 Tax=Glycomyces salinus TaxID=980294 RepID=UPI0018ED4246|nr:aldolase [Glycomyces salinus]